MSAWGADQQSHTTSSSSPSYAVHFPTCSSALPTFACVSILCPVTSPPTVHAHSCPCADGVGQWMASCTTPLDVKSTTTMHYLPAQTSPMPLSSRCNWEHGWQHTHHEQMWGTVPWWVSGQLCRWGVSASGPCQKPISGHADTGSACICYGNPCTCRNVLMVSFFDDQPTLPNKLILWSLTGNIAHQKKNGGIKLL